MFGPYPAFEDLGQGTGYIDPVTNDLFWLYAATYDTITNQWSITVAQRVYLTGVINQTTNASLPGAGSPGGTVLVDANYYYVGFFIGTGDFCWYKISRLDGSLVADTGFIFAWDAAYAYLDGLGSIIHILSGGAVYVINTGTMIAPSSLVSLPKSCNRPGGAALVSPGVAWCRFGDGVSGGFSLLDTTNPLSPSVTSFDLGYTFEYDWVVYNSVTQEIIFWTDSNTINRWSTVSHSIVLTVTHPSAFQAMGPINNGLFCVGLDLYDPTTLDVVATANGYNPLLPPWSGCGGAFGHWFDGNNIIWLKACDLNVYGAIVGLLRLECASGTGQFGVPYDSFLVASGTVPPYTYAIIAGSLPPGLTLNDATGEISGIPSATGDYPYTAQVTDSLDNTATASCVIDIGGPPPPGPASPCGKMFTLELTRDLDANWGDESVFYITQDQPFPFTLRGIVLRLSYNPD